MDLHVKKRLGNGDKLAFTKLLLSWSVNDIFDESLFESKIKKIPDTFNSTKEYFDAFLFPLLEEARADLCSNLSMMSAAPFAKVFSCCRVSGETSSQYYNVKVDHWRNSLAGEDNVTYNILSGDVFVLLESNSDTTPRLHSGQKCILASVVKLLHDDINHEYSSTCIKVRVSQEIDIKFEKTNVLMVYMTNIIQFERIWNALHRRENLKLFKKVLNRSSLDEGTDDCGCSETDPVRNEELDYGFSTLNQSQKDAVSVSVTKIQCKHNFSVELVWGPPGTGKTKTLATLLCILQKRRCRTLTCAPTNVAITTVASHTIDLLKASSARLQHRICPLGSILLFGSKERLNVGSDIEDIYLDFRVKKLKELFSPITGWKCSFASLLKFLQAFESQSHTFIKQEIVQMSGHSNSEQSQSLIQLIRDKFNVVAEQVRIHISIFCTHIVQSFILDHNFKNLISLFDLLDSLESLLLQDTAISHELHPCSEFFEESSVCISGHLQQTSRECISLLRGLIFSLSELRLPQVINKDSMVDFCFRMSSLLFCTASSSFKLFSVPIESLDVLVIDEAAQLKECESTVPLQLPGLRHCILAGDEYQLQAMVKSHLSESVGFGRSLYHRLGSLGWSKHLLNIQYRMNPSISAFPRRMFYRNRIIDAHVVKSDTYEKHYLEGSLYGPYSFINITEGKEERDDGVSRRNMVEAAVVQEIVFRLYRGWCQSPSNQKLSIGVISPYSAQVKTIKKMLGQRFETLGNFVVNVKSIDGFQGSEEDIILVSTVRSNKFGDIGFLSNPQRLNVALTRAKHCLWILGNERTLAKENCWGALITDAKGRKCFFNANEDERIAKRIIKVMKELDQLDDLIKGDSILFKNARWKVLFSSGFIKSLSQLSLHRKKYVLTLLVKLSNGWRPKKINVNPLCESSIQIVKQYKVQDLYVVCTNDIVKESEYIQVLRVWDVLPLEAVPVLVRKVDRIYSLYSDDFVRRCKEKCVEGNIEVPQCWSSNSDVVRYKKCSKTEILSVSGTSDVVPTCIEKTEVKESLLFMKFYSLSSGVVKHLLSATDGTELELPFEVTDDEWEIIHYPRSSFVLGRSGTGKTVVLVMKLFQREQFYHLSLGSTDEVQSNASLSPSVKTEGRRACLRQLFVTVNPNLCHTVKQQISNLQCYVRGEIAKEEANRGHLYEAEQFEDIPNSFLKIPDESYPLTVTLRKFLLILDGTIGTSYFQKFLDRQICSTGTMSSKLIMLQMERKEVSYDKFSTVYWPHLNCKLTKDLDPSRVFTEIISSIKGGMQVEQLEQSRLSLDSYIQLSDSRRSSLDRKARLAIYDLFLNYEKMKRKRGEFDLADLVNDLHSRLYRQRYEGEDLDFVYIDEVQDLTVRQLALFKYVCKNVEDGFVFAGDTAQTIARGVDFRFQDIRSLFYTKFLQGDPSKKSSQKKDKGKICPIFHLSQNFRSHAGILKLANSVIQLIYHFFPQSIDMLNPEFSIINGERPTLLESAPGEDVIMKLFKNNENHGTNIVRFGADQVIIVSDESVRNEMPNHVKENAFVLTVFECKGLEFKDVFLYNFFSSSSIGEHWNVVYEYMQEKNLGSSFPHFPRFNHSKHSGLCHELKQLYVALTRAKDCLWICENHSCHFEAMANYWKKLNLVRVKQFDDSLAQEMVNSSTKEEWKLRGFKFLEVSNYETAAICFSRAGDNYWEKFSHATGLKTTAVRGHCLNSEVPVMLTQAAEMFESIGNNKEAAKCFYDAGNYKRAGDIYLQHFGDSELERACHCYSLAGCHLQAAKIYAKAGLLSECLNACNAGKLYKLGLEYVRSWKQLKLQGSINLTSKEQDFLELCARASYKAKDNREMMKFVKQFASQDSMRIFLKSLGCYDDLMIVKKIGNFLLEADLLHKGQKYKDAARLYIWYAFARSCWKSSLKCGSKKDPPVKELLRKAEACAEKGSPYLLREIRTEIELLSSQSIGLSELKKQLIVSEEAKNLKWEIISTRRILDILLQTDISRYEWESDLDLDLEIHAKEMIAESRVSVETLAYFWKSWKGRIWDTLKHISRAQNNIYWDFCAHYFGVRKSPDSDYFLLYPDAEWVVNYTQRTDQTIGTQDLVTAMHRYWCSQLQSVGLKMLEILDCLQKYFYDSLSMFWKDRILVHVFECAQLMFNSELRQQNQASSAIIKKYIEEAKQRYVALLFSREWYTLILQDEGANRGSIIYRKLKVKLDL